MFGGDGHPARAVFLHHVAAIVCHGVRRRGARSSKLWHLFLILGDFVELTM